MCMCSRKDFYSRTACGLFLFSLILTHLIEKAFLIKLYLEEFPLKDIQNLQKWQNLQCFAWFACWAKCISSVPGKNMPNTMGAYV